MMGFALLTGATGGIGGEILRLFAQDGQDCVLIGRDEVKLRSLCRQMESEYGIRAIPIEQDLRRADAPSHIHSRTKNEGITVDGIINCAGISRFAPFGEVGLNEILGILQVNLLSPISLVQLYLDEMKERRRGFILNVASTAAFKPSQHHNIYNVSKSGLLYFSLALHDELDTHDIHVTCACPGPTATPFFLHSGASGMYSSGRKLLSPSFVARVSLDGLKKNRRLVLPGTGAKINYFLSKYIPGELLSSLLRYRTIQHNGRCK